MIKVQTSKDVFPAITELIETLKQNKEPKHSKNLNNAVTASYSTSTEAFAGMRKHLTLARAKEADILGVDGVQQVSQILLIIEQVLGHPLWKVPISYSLTKAECLDFRSRIVSKLGLNENASDLELALEIQNRQSSVAGVNAGSFGFSLSGVLSKLKIRCGPDLFINLDGKFGAIDKLKAGEMSDVFYDYWTSNEVDVFDQSLDWILSVGPKGQVKLLKF